MMLSQAPTYSADASQFFAYESQSHFSDDATGLVSRPDPVNYDADGQTPIALSAFRPFPAFDAGEVVCTEAIHIQMEAFSAGSEVELHAAVRPFGSNTQYYTDGPRTAQSIVEEMQRAMVYAYDPTLIDMWVFPRNVPNASMGSNDQLGPGACYSDYTIVGGTAVATVVGNDAVRYNILLLATGSGGTVDPAAGDTVTVRTPHQQVRITVDYYAVLLGDKGAAVHVV
jgi:hypothetical protein